MNNIQKNLLDAFELSGLTYDELAKRTDLPKSALFRYLNGDTEKIPIDRFQAICYELHVDAAYLLGWKSNLEENESFIINTFRSLPEPGKKYLLQQAQIAKITFGEKSKAVSNTNIV